MIDWKPQMTVDESIALGRQYCQAGRFEQARNIFREVLSTNPNQFDALHLLGVIALSLKDYDAAEGAHRSGDSGKPQSCRGSLSSRQRADRQRNA